MRKKRANRILDQGQVLMLGLGLLCVLALLLLGKPGAADPNPGSVAAEAATPFPAPEGLRIAVGSDLQLDPDHEGAAGGGHVSYNLELVDALLWDAREQGAEMILLTGDLVNGGKPHRHRALAEKLYAAEAEGLSVYVLPGNHDLAPIGQRDFAALYADFGYDEACSRDAASLSYCIKREGLMLLMMDTAGYSVSAIDLPGAPGGDRDDAFLTEETLRWAEGLLRQARDEGLRVLAAGHYNLLPEICQTPGSGFHVENGQRFAELLRAYGVPLYLSGHMHVPAVYQAEGLTELLTGYLLSYPAAYSILDLADSGLRYTPRRIDVDAWAKQTGQTDPALTHFAQWQQEGLRSYSTANVEYMTQRNPLNKTEAGQAADFFYAAMDAYWSGTLIQQRTALEAMPGYAPFFRCAEGYAYGWWLRDLMENSSPLLSGFTLELEPLS